MIARTTRARTLASCAIASALFVSGCEGRPRPEGPHTEPPKRTGPAISVIDLGSGVPEQEAPSLFGSVGRKKSFDELLNVIAESGAEKNKKTVGVLVKFGGANIGAARSQEIGEQLEKLKAKKKVFCHADGLSNTTFMAAARGCSSIYISPAGEVEAVGIAAQILYMRRLLADELHLSIDMLQVGKFKGAEEPLTRDGPSPEARQSLTSVLVDMRQAWLETVRKARPQPGIVEALEDGPYSPTKAKEIGLIDEVGYAADALAAVKTAASAVREEVVFGSGAEEKGGDLEDLVRALAGEGSESGPIALLRATGSISMTSGGNGILGGRGGIIEKDIDRTLRSLEKDDDVKAVVVRIDSPGGSALASDLIWHHLMRVRKKKPLVFSVGEMAASGGMYLASAGDYIFAEPMSIVGSIGVVGGKIGAGDALEKIGVHAETFPANIQKPGAAARAAYESPFMRWDDATRARVLEGMTSVYELFLSRVAEGRSTRGRTMTREKVAESAEGKIFSGVEGQRRGLVDEIGGLTAAIAKARELAKLPESAHVAVVGTKPSFLDALDPPGPAEERVRGAMTPSAIAVLERLAPDLVPFVSSMAPLAEGERAVVAVPYSLTVK
ncbi:MAG: S49 family peptidase [Labilithrix sp.]|nr:S49 family peptidase [Labilithrix sp.]